MYSACFSCNCKEALAENSGYKSMSEGLSFRSIFRVVVGYRIKFPIMMVVYVINKARHNIYYKAFLIILID